MPWDEAGDSPRFVNSIHRYVDNYVEKLPSFRFFCCSNLKFWFKFWFEVDSISILLCWAPKNAIKARWFSASRITESIAWTSAATLVVHECSRALSSDFPVTKSLSICAWSFWCSTGRFSACVSRIKPLLDGKPGALPDDADIAEDKDIRINVAGRDSIRYIQILNRAAFDSWWFWREFFFFAAGFGFVLGFLVLCFPASLLLSFSAFPPLCFSASLLFCFSTFLLSLLICFSASLLSLLLCFSAFVPFYFYYSTFSSISLCLSPVCILNEPLERP